MSVAANQDLFLSYRTCHAARVDALVGALVRQEVRVWRDVDKIRNGTSITGALRAAIAGSLAVGVSATDDYADSMICMWELVSAWIAAERVTRGNQRLILLRPLELSGSRRVRLGPLLDTRAFDLPDNDLEGAALQIAQAPPARSSRPSLSRPEVNPTFGSSTISLPAPPNRRSMR